MSHVTSEEVPAQEKPAPTIISADAMDRMRTCWEAARLRAQHKSFRQIAQELGFADAADAREAVQTWLKIVPAEDGRALRRDSDLAGMTLAGIEQRMKDLRAELGLPEDGSEDPLIGELPPVPEDGGDY